MHRSLPALLLSIMNAWTDVYSVPWKRRRYNFAFTFFQCFAGLVPESLCIGPVITSLLMVPGKNYNNYVEHHTIGNDVYNKGYSEHHYVYLL